MSPTDVALVTIPLRSGLPILDADAVHELIGTLSDLSASTSAAVLTSDATLLVAVDVLVWQEGLREAAERPAEGAKGRSLWITGTLTDRARSEMSSRGWAVQDDVRP